MRQLGKTLSSRRFRALLFGGSSVLLLCMVAGPLGAERQYILDGVGRLAGVVDSGGTVIAYMYDGAGNRLTRAVVTGGAPESIWALLPDTTGVGATLDTTVAGDGLTTTTGVTFQQAGLSATLRGAATNNTAPIRITVDAAVPPGSYPFTLERSAGGTLPSGAVVLVIGSQPYISALVPNKAYQGETIEGWTIEGERLGQTTEIQFPSQGASAVDVFSVPGGNSVTSRLQVDLDAVAEPTDVRTRSAAGLSNTVPLGIFQHGAGLVGDYFNGSSALDGAGLPVMPLTGPTFRRSDVTLRTGTDNNYGWRPCAFGSLHCVSAGFVVRWEGYVYLDAPGNWTFGTRSVDASRVRIAGQDIVLNPGIHPTAVLATGIFQAPYAGSFPIQVDLASQDSFAGIDLLYQAPGAGTLQLVPGSALWSKGAGSAPVDSMFTETAVTYTNPAPPPLSTGPTDSMAVQAVSYVNPAPPPLSTGPTVVIALEVVSLAAGPVAVNASPATLSRSAAMPRTLILGGLNLSGANGLIVSPSDGITVGIVSANGAGDVVTAEITLTGSTPLGHRKVQVTGPGWQTPRNPEVRFEVVP